MKGGGGGRHWKGAEGEEKGKGNGVGERGERDG